MGNHTATVAGLVWRSPDGLSWTEARVDILQGVTLSDLASDGTTIVATGYADLSNGPWGLWTWSPGD